MEKAGRHLGSNFQIRDGIVLTLSMLYPIIGLWSKTNSFKPTQWELDGTAHITRYNPDEAAAMKWLWNAPLGTIVEISRG